MVNKDYYYTNDQVTSAVLNSVIRMVVEVSWRGVLLVWQKLEWYTRYYWLYLKVCNERRTGWYDNNNNKTTIYKAQ